VSLIPVPPVPRDKRKLMNGSIPAQGAHLVFEFERGMALPTKVARGRTAAMADAAHNRSLVKVSKFNRQKVHTRMEDELETHIICSMSSSSYRIPSKTNHGGGSGGVRLDGSH